MALFEDSSGYKEHISRGSIGGKIKKYREQKGWTQKELGKRCGFLESTADVRIAQYEQNKIKPKEKVLQQIADALEIDICALKDNDMSSFSMMCHALFDIEDFHGLHPVKKSDGYYLEFSENTVYDDYISEREYNAFLEAWYEKRQEFHWDKSDSPEEKGRKIREYSLWRAGYPFVESQKMTERIKDSLRMSYLQAEMDELNAKMKNDEELAKIDNALEDTINYMENHSGPITLESEFIYLIKDTIEKGLNIDRYTPLVSVKEIDYENDDVDLLSVKSEDILNVNPNKILFANLLYAINTIQKYGIKLSRRITSRTGELFITYSYPPSQYRYFSNLQKYWNDMIYIIEKKGEWTDQEIEKLEVDFKEKITGENDISFSDCDNHIEE